jgi:hypothetical protein
MKEPLIETYNAKTEVPADIIICDDYSGDGIVIGVGQALATRSEEMQFVSLSPIGTYLLGKRLMELGQKPTAEQLRIFKIADDHVTARREAEWTALWDQLEGERVREERQAKREKREKR